MAFHPAQRSLKKGGRTLLKRARRKKVGIKSILKRRPIHAKKKQKNSAPDCELEGSKASVMEQHFKEEHEEIGDEGILDRSSQEHVGRSGRTSRSPSFTQQDSNDTDVNNEQSTYTPLGESTTDNVLQTGCWMSDYEVVLLNTRPQQLSFSSSVEDDSSTTPDLVSDMETESEAGTLLAESTPAYDMLDGIGLGILNLGTDEDEGYNEGAATWIGGLDG